MKPRRNTKQRQMVLETVRSHRDHPTADEIYIDLRQNDDKISRGTVYRNLNILVDNKEIQSVKIRDAERYDWRQDRHYHLKCTQCNEIIDIDIPYNEGLDKEVSEEMGYKLTYHNTVFEGICPSCQLKELDKDKDK